MKTVRISNFLFTIVCFEFVVMFCGYAIRERLDEINTSIQECHQVETIGVVKKEQND